MTSTERRRREQSDATGGQRLAPTAQRILKASKRILERKGYSSLTWKAIADEAGVNQSLISYYFGNKAGLLEAVVESLFSDSGIDPTRSAQQTSDGPDTIHWLVQLQRHASSNRRTNRAQQELMPHALRTKRLRTRFSELYELHRGFDADCLRGTTPDLDPKTLESLAALTVAVADGLGIQLAIDPHFDHDATYAVWESMLLYYLQREESQARDHATAASEEEQSLD